MSDGELDRLERVEEAIDCVRKGGDEAIDEQRAPGGAARADVQASYVESRIEHLRNRIDGRSLGR